MTCEFMMISILMCVHNAEKTLCSALDSVTSQTYKEIEIVVVNDGSSDGSLEILKKFSENFPSVRIITQENQGIGSARNRCLAEASHPWVTFIDADDLWHPQKLELQINTFLAVPNMDCVLTGNQELFSEDEIRENDSRKLVSKPLILLVDIFKQLTEINFNFQPATALSGC
jgi:glycosyltransferase involved in cell wall biosynthesis